MMRCQEKCPLPTVRVGGMASWLRLAEIRAWSAAGAGYARGAGFAREPGGAVATALVGTGDEPARLRDLRHTAADVRGIGPTDVGRVGAGTTALVRRGRSAVGIRRRGRLVGRHEKFTRGRLAVDLRDSPYELVRNALREVRLRRTPHLVDEVVRLEVDTHGCLPRHLVDGDAELDGSRRLERQQPAAVLDRERRDLEGAQDERVEGVPRDLQLTLLEADLVALEVVEERPRLRERAGGQDHGQDGHRDGQRHRGQHSLRCHVSSFSLCRVFEARRVRSSAPNKKRPFCETNLEGAIQPPILQYY